MYDTMYNKIAYKLMGKYGYSADRITNLILENFLNVHLSRFELEGVPEGFNEVYGNRNLYELFLFFAPAVAWFDLKGVGVIALPASTIAEYNAVGKPTKWNVFSINGQFSMELNENNSVLMFNDQALTIPYLHLEYEARFLRKLDLAMNQNIDLQSTPYIIEAFDENVKSANSWSQAIKNFSSRIVLRKKREVDKRNEMVSNSQVLNTAVELKVKDMQTAYTSFLYRAYTYMGIKNIDIEKSERLLTGEISGNDSIIQLNYTNALHTRELAFDEVNKMFGTSFKIKARELESLLPKNVNPYYSMLGGVNNAGNSSKIERDTSKNSNN